MPGYRLRLAVNIKPTREELFRCDSLVVIELPQYSEQSDSANALISKWVLYFKTYSDRQQYRKSIGSENTTAIRMGPRRK